MKATQHLVRIECFAVRLRASWFLVLALVAWGLAGDVFPMDGRPQRHSCP